VKRSGKRATAGRFQSAIRPFFRQKSGLFDYVWFSHGVAVPYELYDNTLVLLDDPTFTCHAGYEAIHVRRHSKVIGFI